MWEKSEGSQLFMPGPSANLLAAEDQSSRAVIYFEFNTFSDATDGLEP